MVPSDIVLDRGPVPPTGRGDLSDRIGDWNSVKICIRSDVAYWQQVATNLENLEKSGNLKHQEKSWNLMRTGKWPPCL